MIRVLIADDHTLVREGLKQILDETPDITVGGEACGGQEALCMIRTERWDVVLLDISMPGMNGVDVLKQLRCEFPKLPVIMLSVHPEQHYAARALRAGASGYLTKNAKPDQLVEAVRKAASGGKYVSQSVLEELAFGGTGAEKPLHKTLSDREYEVMCRIASGKTLAEIAEEMVLSPKTISTYRARILEKMNLRNNAEIIRYAVENLLVDG